MAGSLLPLVLTSVIGGALIALVVTGKRAGQSLRLRLAAIGTLSFAAGFGAGLVIQYGLSAIGGSYLANAGVIALLVAAVATSVAGLGSLFGKIGVGLAALTFILLANPFSGATAAPELLPQPWGAIGQLMPPGAAVTALRSTGFFDGAGAGTAVVVLTVWLGVGLALLGAASRRARRSRSPVATGDLEHRRTPVTVSV